VHESIVVVFLVVVSIVGISVSVPTVGAIKVVSLRLVLTAGVWGESVQLVRVVADDVGVVAMVMSLFSMFLNFGLINRMLLTVELHTPGGVVLKVVSELFL
jgi:hypothetical protein